MLPLHLPEHSYENAKVVFLGKRRTMDWTRAGDPGLRALSYYTDNGAYYYYNTANGTGTCAGR